jgi:hypothetical protein
VKVKVKEDVGEVEGEENEKEHLRKCEGRE